jgi:hypothetical protein
MRTIWPARIRNEPEGPNTAHTERVDPTACKSKILRIEQILPRTSSAEFNNNDRFESPIASLVVGRSRRSGMLQ